ncbi:transposase [Cupriavidus gilardii]
MKKRFTDEQIIGILREAEIGAMSIKALCKKHNVTEQTFFRWLTRPEYG